MNTPELFTRLSEALGGREDFEASLVEANYDADAFVALLEARGAPAELVVEAARWLTGAAGVITLPNGNTLTRMHDQSGYLLREIT
jgi:hypothetical protein